MIQAIAREPAAPAIECALAAIGPDASVPEIIVTVLKACAGDPRLDALEAISGILERRALARGRTR